jgi:hypothetical protein
MRNIVPFWADSAFQLVQVQQKALSRPTASLNHKEYETKT